MAENQNYDAAFCGNLAIHQTNSIQDYGFLLVIDIENFEIVQGSENLDKLCSKHISELIGASLSDFMTAEDLKSLRTETAKGPRNRVPFSFNFINEQIQVPVNVLCHVKNDMVIMEIEVDDQEPERSFSSAFQEVRSFISTLENTSDLQQICQASIHEIRRITGFDGIRMYRFDRDWNGTVIAEEIQGDLESYLGNTFPASDVPKQARALYIKNPFRLIPNREYKAYKLFPVINSITNGFLDLSDCNLRSVARVHLEYMANMNVTASMSIRVMVEGALWGLISCHHIKPKYMSTESRFIFEWLSMEISYRISSILKQEQLAISAEKLKLKASLTENIFSKGDILKGLLEDENQILLKLFNCDGCAVCLNGKVTTLGTVPLKEDIENLLLWADGKALGNTFATHELGEIYEEGKSYTDMGSGILIIPLNRTKGDLIICFRPEKVKSIKWGGDPNQAINFEKDKLSYHPRNSFKIWMQTVYGQAEIWNDTEMEMAESLRNFLFQYSADQQFN
ncbi:GAF domain-containing protein [Pedobacter sp. L105]|uniref:GAF domain-containing protein n=1 Tax=Pedobacter sp. L105 TaxID=1641871 RepID=UPI00131AB479|nr:GAF domain-containing protein [Pedobacter sp. L105]